MTGQLSMDLISDPALYAERLVFNAPTPDPEMPTLPIRRCAFTAMELKKSPIAGQDESGTEAQDLKKRLHDTLEACIRMGYRHFFTSATQGIELWAAEMVLSLRDQNPGIVLELVIPYDTHSNKWSDETRERYMAVREQADIVTTISHAYEKGAIFARNRYLMENCQLFLTVYIPEAETATEKLAKRASWNGKQVCNVPVIRPNRRVA